jgi:hypothetical protein
MAKNKITKLSLEDEVKALKKQTQLQKKMMTSMRYWKDKK